MASTSVPNLAVTPRAGALATPTTADTSLTAPTNVSIIFTAGATGSRINLVRITQIASSVAAGCVNLFLYDGTNYHFFDVYQYPIATITAASEPIPVDIPYPQLVIPTGWSLRATDTVNAGTAHFSVTALGGDFT